jgi:signal transduction histidine kinase
MALEMKNISRAPLGVSPDELMERFVRGDSCRHTEGSGLGLNIAKSLTELQGAAFDLAIDGDLFKVTLAFDCIDDTLRMTTDL